MSFGNAISARAKMNTVYRQMLEVENSAERKNAIEFQIKLNLEEMESLRKEQAKIFGKPTPLLQETKIIETDRETKGQKVTVLNAPVRVAQLPSITMEKVINPPKSTRLGNSLRDTLKSQKSASAEESLKAKIAAAKAAKKA